MYRLALTLLVAVITLIARGQSYPPLLDNSMWSVRVTTFMGNISDYWLQYELDTTINATVYRKYVRSWAGSDPDLVREDVANKKVYKYLPWTGQEILMFDFTLQLSDNIVLGNGGNYVVDAVDSINVADGSKRRRLQLIRYVNNFPLSFETWIEGVGHTAMPLTPFFLMVSDPDYRLMCSYQNGSQVYNEGIANNTLPTDCPELPTAITDAAFPMVVFASPNPSSGMIALSFSTALPGPLILRVHDAHGKLVLERSLPSIGQDQRVQLDLSNYPAGVYHARMGSAKKQLNARIILHEQ